MLDKSDIVVSIKNLGMSYGDNQVLNNINLDVLKGQIIGYIGPNGAGKSTTIKIMLGIIDNYKGQVFIFGEDISKNSVDYKKRIGYVPEVSEVYDTLTAKEYLTFIGEIYGLEYLEADKRALHLLKLFEIDEVYNSRISSYSKGMKQKLLIVASLIHNPDILFFDEPLSGLDANSVMVFKEVMLELAKEGKTIFYSSHIMDVVEKISNRIILIHSGNIIADGTFLELSEKCKEGSLEQIFNQLTGFNKHTEIAKEFISVISGV